jgi:hypothetical protein
VGESVYEVAGPWQGIPGAVVVACAALALAGLGAASQPALAAYVAAIGVGAGVLAVRSVLFQVKRIALDDDGLTFTARRRRRHLPWSRLAGVDLRTYRNRPSLTWKPVDARPFRTPVTLVDMDRLLDDVARRASQAGVPLDSTTRRP